MPGIVSKTINKKHRKRIKITLDGCQGTKVNYLKKRTINESSQKISSKILIDLKENETFCRSLGTKSKINRKSCLIIKKSETNRIDKPIYRRSMFTKRNKRC